MDNIITKFGRPRTMKDLVARDIRASLLRGKKLHNLGLYGDGSRSPEDLLLPNKDVPIECISKDLWGINLESCDSDEYDTWCMNYADAFDKYQLEWDKQVKSLFHPSRNYYSEVI